MQLVEVGRRGPFLVTTACFGHVGVGEAVVHLGQTEDGEWLLWWGEQDGIGGALYDNLSEAWREFRELTTAA